EEQAEIHRILLEMTRRIGENSDAILAGADILAELELQFAKARFAEDYRCVPVVFGIREDGRPQESRLSEVEGSTPSQARLLLHKARHPLLERNLKVKGGQIVPITVELEGTRQLHRNWEDRKSTRLNSSHVAI